MELLTSFLDFIVGLATAGAGRVHDKKKPSVFSTWYYVLIFLFFLGALFYFFS